MSTNSNPVQRTRNEEESGVQPILPFARARQLVSRWSALQPTSSLDPHAVHSLQGQTAELLKDCMQCLVAVECADEANAESNVAYDLLDATYVLERLEWCMLHNVPYVERPRAAQID